MPENDFDGREFIGEDPILIVEPDPVLVPIDMEENDFNDFEEGADAEGVPVRSVYGTELEEAE